MYIPIPTGSVLIGNFTHTFELLCMLLFWKCKYSQQKYLTQQSLHIVLVCFAGYFLILNVRPRVKILLVVHLVSKKSQYLIPICRYSFSAPWQQVLQSVERVTYFSKSLFSRQLKVRDGKLVFVTNLLNISIMLLRKRFPTSLI